MATDEWLIEIWDGHIDPHSGETTEWDLPLCVLRNATKQQAEIAREAIAVELRLHQFGDMPMLEIRATEGLSDAALLRFLARLETARPPNERMENLRTFAKRVAVLAPTVSPGPGTETTELKLTHRTALDYIRTKGPVSNDQISRHLTGKDLPGTGDTVRKWCQVGGVLYRQGVRNKSGAGYFVETAQS